jgi:hypothetical protein
MSNNCITIINNRFRDVVFYKMGTRSVAIGTAAPINATFYGAAIHRETRDECIAIAMCCQGNIVSNTLDKLPWLSLHLRKYNDVEYDGLTEQRDLDWEAMGAKQDLNIDGYDDNRDVDMVESQSSRLRVTYLPVNNEAISVEYEGANKDPRALGGNDLPERTTFVPLLESFSCVIARR